MAAQCEGTIDPAEAGGGGYEDLGVLRAEEAVALIDGAEDLQCASGIGGWFAEFPELPVGPIEEEHLAIELVLSGGDDFIEPVVLSEFLQLRIVSQVELESAAVL